MTFQDMQKLAVILCPENNIFVLVVIRVYACMCVCNVIACMTAYFLEVRGQLLGVDSLTLGSNN